MWDYKERKKFYDDLVNNEDVDFDEGIYAYEGRIYVDSGYGAWSDMVSAGVISGEGAEPVTTLDYAYALNKVKELLGDSDGTVRGALRFFQMAGLFDNSHEN
jgi:hypothetical protein